MSTLSMSYETLTRYAAEHIHNGKTLEQAAELIAKHSRCGHCSVSSIRRAFKKCLTPRGEKALLEEARLNKKKQKQAQALISCDNPEDIENAPSFDEQENVKEVIVTETGYLMNYDINVLIESGMDIFVPEFCISKELRKLSYHNANAEQFLTLFWSTHAVTTINLHGEEVLYEDPKESVKERSKGVVAVAVELDSLGYKVHLYTTSREVENLAVSQGCDIDVIRVEPVR